MKHMQNVRGHAAAVGNTLPQVSPCLSASGPRGPGSELASVDEAAPQQAEHRFRALERPTREHEERLNELLRRVKYRETLTLKEEAGRKYCFLQKKMDHVNHMEGDIASERLSKGNFTAPKLSAVPSLTQRATRTPIIVP